MQALAGRYNRSPEQPIGHGKSCVCWETCRTSPARSTLTKRSVVEPVVSSALDRRSQWGDLMREDNKVIAVSLSSEGDIEAKASGEVGDSWRPARSPEEKITDTSLLL